MKKIELLFLLLFLVLSVNGQVKESMLPLPTQAQLDWQDAELRFLFLTTCMCSTESNITRLITVSPMPDINIFNPEQLDTDQWIRSVKAMGAGIAILTATHETGFALYQSDVNPYCMKALKWKDGKGDIVRDFVNFVGNMAFGRVSISVSVGTLFWEYMIS